MTPALASRRNTFPMVAAAFAVGAAFLAAGLAVLMIGIRKRHVEAIDTAVDDDALVARRSTHGKGRACRRDHAIELQPPAGVDRVPTGRIRRTNVQRRHTGP